MKMETDYWENPVMDDLCVYLGQEVCEITIPGEIVINGQTYPSGSIYSIVYNVFSFAPLENRADRSTDAKNQTARLYVKEHLSERWRLPLVECNVSQLTSEPLENFPTPAK